MTHGRGEILTKKLSTFLIVHSTLRVFSLARSMHLSITLDMKSHLSTWKKKKKKKYFRFRYSKVVGDCILITRT